jgi:hypothetical protein
MKEPEELAVGLRDNLIALDRGDDGFVCCDLTPFHDESALGEIWRWCLFKAEVANNRSMIWMMMAEV